MRKGRDPGGSKFLKNGVCPPDTVIVKEERVLYVNILVVSAVKNWFGLKPVTCDEE